MATTPIQAVDERVLPFAPEQIWPVLADVTLFPQWYPASIGVQVRSVTEALVGTEFEIKPRGGRAFGCRVEAIEPPRRMGMRYPGPFIVGTGEWRLDAAAAGSTRVAYALDVQAHGWLVAVLGKVLPLGNLHSKFMQEILGNLEAEVRRRS